MPERQLPRVPDERMVRATYRLNLNDLLAEAGVEDHGMRTVVIEGGQLVVTYTVTEK